MLPYIVAPLLLALSSAVSVTALTVSSPAINQCQDVTFQIDGANGQVWFNVLPAVNPCGSDPIFEVGPFTPTNGGYTWHNSEVAAGTQVVIVVDDTSNDEAWSTTITVGGSAASCSTSSAPSNAPASVQHGTTTHHTSATQAPVNAAAPTDTASASGAFSVKASWSTGLVSLLVGAAFFA